MTADDAQIELAIHPSSVPVAAADRKELLASPGFGRVFTDHMVTISWNADSGWHDGQLVPYGAISLDPATAVLHYSQQVFEGLKAYRQVDDSIVVFRPLSNASRFNRSLARMAMPSFPESGFVHAIETLVSQDSEWVPGAHGYSLYLRPFVIATEKGLAGGKPSSSYLFTLIASPAGSYFSRDDHSSVSVWLEPVYSRAAPGGTGEAKTAGNYSGGLIGQIRAQEHECDQVVWLDSCEHKYVEEMGVMNLFFVLGAGAKARLVTPGLTGTLLGGVTRDSLLTLASDLGIPTEERRISVEEWREGCESGEISEVFACGTAAVVTAVSSVQCTADRWSVGDGMPGAVTTRLRDELTGIQYGRLPDVHGWNHRIISG